MPKVTLTFNLPEESYDHKVALAAHDYKRAVDEIQALFRKIRKYSDFADPDWYFKRKKGQIMPDLKAKYRLAQRARSSFFQDLDEQFRQILAEILDIS